MSEDCCIPSEVSPLPDSITNLDSEESHNRPCSPVVSAEPNSTETPLVEGEIEPSVTPDQHVTSPSLPDSSPGCQMVDGVLKSNCNTDESDNHNAHPIIPSSIAPTDVLLSGSSTSAFRPFITSINATLSVSRSHAISSTPVSRRSERSTTLPGASPFSSIQSLPQHPSPENSLIDGEGDHGIIINSSVNDDNGDGRTTASAPPCTPAPEPYQQPQSPFRNTRQIKKIDLLAMSRSRQCDRAENARRDGRLAPSPRKKDEVLRNSGFAYPTSRLYGGSSSLRLSMHQPTSIPPERDSELSPERSVTRSSNTGSPNVDVVSVDETQPDPTKCMFSIQFHDFSPAEHMMKCNLCGFVTNNSRFYRRHRRLHNRQCQPNLIQCSLCDYSTSQIRRMREHTITHHHMSHPHNTQVTGSASSTGGPSSVASTVQHRNASGVPMLESGPHIRPPPLQGQLLVSGGGGGSSVTNFILPVSSHQPINLGGLTGAIPPPSRASATQPISAASTLGLPTYIPAPMDAVGPPPLPPPPQPPHGGPSSTLQHPPRGSAMLGNYSTDHHQAPNFMGSVLSSLMSPPHPTQQPSVSTSGFFRQVADNRRHHPAAAHNNFTLEASLHDELNFRRLWGGTASTISNNIDSVSVRGNVSSSYIKVKAEPSSSSTQRQQTSIQQINRGVYDLESSTHRDRTSSRRANRRPSDAGDSESGMDMSSDDPASSPRPPPSQRPRYDNRVSTGATTEQTRTATSGSRDASFNIEQINQTGGSTSQRPMPFIKIEFPPHRDACSFNHPTFPISAMNNNLLERNNSVLVDREVQCDIITTHSVTNRELNGHGTHRHAGGRTQSETVSSAGGGISGNASSTNGSSAASGIDTKCHFCGVTFDDEVLFSIHIGCHSHTDPFLCNVCGKQCHNKYGFYTHIMRGHQSRPST